MATGFIGISRVPFNTPHVEDTGISRRIRVEGVPLQYVCPLAGVKHAVVTVTGTASIGALPAAGQNGSAPKAVAGYVRAVAVLGTLFHSYSVTLGPGEGWSGVAASVVFVNANSTALPETSAVLFASVLEVVP